jgi:hypothetical protein
MARSVVELRGPISVNRSDEEGDRQPSMVGARQAVARASARSDRKVCSAESAPPGRWSAIASSLSHRTRTDCAGAEAGSSAPGASQRESRRVRYHS